MSISSRLQEIKSKIGSARLVLVSKTHPPELIMEAYNSGQRVFGENRVQEMCAKQPLLPQDIQWHQIGTLQTNKVKYIIPFVSLIHSVDSLKLLEEINRQALKNNRVVDCLLQVYIADEETKHGLSREETYTLLHSASYKEMQNIRITGLMGMATNTNDEQQIRNEFKSLKLLLLNLKKDFFHKQSYFTELSMGMSGDYEIAVQEGATMVRVGSLVFSG